MNKQNISRTVDRTKDEKANACAKQKIREEGSAENSTRGKSQRGNRNGN